jgi:signal transduction histidine kinase/HAMP domain-containing protein
MGFVSFLSRARKRLDPRRSVAARLLFGLFLAFLIPGAVLVLLLEQRVAELREASLERFVGVRRAQASRQLQQDATFRAEWIDRRAALIEEAGWSVAQAVQDDLTGAFDGSDLRPPHDADGHIWTAVPESDSVGFISPAHANDPRALEDFERTRGLGRVFAGLRARRPTIKSVSVWTASGVVRLSPWVDIHEAIRQSGGALETFRFNQNARFPQRLPPTEDAAIWSGGANTPRLLPENRTEVLYVPVRDAAGSLIAAVSMDVDARRYASEAIESTPLVGDIWFAVESSGRSLVMPARVAEMLHWKGTPTETLGEFPDPERQRLARNILTGVRTMADYQLSGRVCRLASAPVRTTGWIFVEGFSAPALAKLTAEAEQEMSSRSYSDLERYVFLGFLLLLTAVFAVVVLISRRITAPVHGLVQAAESIGQGRAVEVAGVSKQDEIGRLASAIDRMGRRVERRVETLRRLHALLRTSYRVTDLREILARASEAIAAFTRAERVWFYLHDSNTNRLVAAWPGWNLSEDFASKLTMSVDTASISGMVFKSGEVYVSNDLEHDPYVNRRMRAVVSADNAICCPLKTEEKTLGVVVATNRPGGFGHEEVDALTSFADAASLLIHNSRLYEMLNGTVEELRHASRLKDHFIQNVNHELRTPLTAIVGWTDLLEEEEQVDDETLRRGLRQVRQSARVLLALIDDLLDLARLDRGALALELKPVSLPEVVTRSMDTVRLMAKARGVALIPAPMPDDMVPVRADALRLQQVLWNLLANAIKFTPRHGRVIVRVDREPERYLISVEDDGIGIPESELPHIFERFRQVDGSPTRRHAGLGIGLALARSLVELHGGAIWAESVAGHGSRFTFALPIPAGSRRVSDAVQDDAAENSGDVAARGSRREDAGTG